MSPPDSTKSSPDPQTPRPARPWGGVGSRRAFLGTWLREPVSESQVDGSPQEGPWCHLPSDLLGSRLLSSAGAF